jgi:hypothetical protein
MTQQPNNHSRPADGSPAPQPYDAPVDQREQYGYGQTGTPAPGNQPPMTPGTPASKAPLDRKAKRGAMVAGAVSFTVMTIGCAVAVVPVTIAVVVAFVAGAFALIASTAGGGNQVQEWFNTNFPQFASMWLLWIGIFVVVGIIVWVVGLLVSIVVLKAHGVSRPAAVTWSGLGIGIVASAVVSGIVYPVVSIFTSSFAGVWSTSSFGTVPVVITAIVALAGNAAIGLFSWWWMAHVLRRSSVPATPTAAG